MLRATIRVSPRATITRVATVGARPRASFGHSVGRRRWNGKQQEQHLPFRPPRSEFTGLWVTRSRTGDEARIQKTAKHRRSEPASQEGAARPLVPGGRKARSAMCFDTTDSQAQTHRLPPAWGSGAAGGKGSEQATGRRRRRAPGSKQSLAARPRPRSGAF